MNHQSQFLIPDFQLHEIIAAEYGYTMTGAPGNSYYCKCPIHDHSTPGAHGSMRVYAAPGENTPKHGGYTCPRPGTGGNAWTFMHEHMGLPMPQDPDFDETLRYIADLLELELKPREGHEPSPADKARKLMRDIKDNLQPIDLGEPNSHYQQADDGRWLYRGIEPMTWLQYGVGMLRETNLKQIVSSYDREVMQAAGIKKWRNIGYEWLLEGVIAMRPSPNGMPVGMIVRRYPQLTNRSNSAGYIKNSGSSQILDTQKYLFGVDGADGSDEPTLFVVEGEFDQLALRVRGMPNAVTYGSGQPAQGQIERLRDRDEHLVFIADADENKAGFKHIAYMAERLPLAEFVILPGQDTDPDAFVREQGVQELQQLPRYSALQVQMLAEDDFDFDRGRWARNQRALTQKYMTRIVNNPTIHDENNIHMLSSIGSCEQDYLKSWMVWARNQNNLQAAGCTPVDFEPA